MSTASRPAPVTFERPVETHDLLAARRGVVRFLDVPAAGHLAVDGTGQPGGPEFGEAFGALFPVAYTLHFALKRRGVSASIGAIEGQFRFDDREAAAPGAIPAAGEPYAWQWRLMLPVPAEATDEDVAAAIAEVARKQAPPALARLHLERWVEGPSAQVLHVGPYDRETPTIALLHERIAAAGLRPRGLHHEIYLSDPNRTAPERLRTIVRQPEEPAP